MLQKIVLRGLKKWICRLRTVQMIAVAQFPGNVTAQRNTIMGIERNWVTLQKIVAAAYCIRQIQLRIHQSCHLVAMLRSD